MYPQPKKSLGQNFLIDPNIRRKIISIMDFNNRDAVLEIGAGRGELTRMLAARVKFIYALEIDRFLSESLQQEFCQLHNLKVINCDILKFDLDKAFFGLSAKINVFGNIPYYITTPIIEHLLKYKHKIKIIFLTVQKEFAQRMVSLPSSRDYGAFSLFVQYHFEPRIAFNIKKGSFYPVPKVDSSLISLKPRLTSAVEVADERQLFSIIRASFNQRRKVLRNSMQKDVSKEKMERIAWRYANLLKLRPEDLSLRDFAELANA
ncbi:MAG: 16S rRNA (adenine(1518)-N(6)/adenine(1519)-N(6))-dimethyltransferase RsmA [Candidatus Omnitrophota bacterium]